MDNNNFWNLIQNFEVKIPIIQRDYAQGREDNEVSTKRDKFLIALHDALIKPAGQQSLDYVYGEVKGSCFSPLDGQQRLTTLFLLHWYIASKENKLDEDVKSVLNKFNYETRISSREFCHALVQQGCPIGSSSVSSSIKSKCNWWVLSWAQDPTIKGMLTMLDAIQKRFKEDNLWDKLMSNRISFINITISDFGLSDELYVKMNARGKALSDFENWKAEFEKHLFLSQWEEGVSRQNTFSYLIDTEWTDLFWRHFNAEQSREMDRKMMNFIHSIQLEHVVMTRNLDKETRLDNFPYYTPDKYEKGDFEALCQRLKLWSKKGLGEQSIFKQACEEKASYPQRVLFAAVSFALDKGLYPQSPQSADWLRVVRNICQNSTIDSLPTYRSALELIKELSEGCEDIYQWLRNPDLTIASKHASEQVQEEMTKAKLFHHNAAWKELILEHEDSAFAQGSIQFALRCMDYQNKPESFDAASFSQISKIVNQYFDQIDNCPEIKHLLWRALLSIGDGKCYLTWNSWSYVKKCSKHKLPNKLHGNKWSDHSLQYFCKAVISRDYAIELVRTLLQSEHHGDLSHYLNQFQCPQDRPAWQQLLIKDSSSHYLQHCTEGFLCVNEGSSQCWLIIGQRPSDENRYKPVPPLK